MSNYGEFDWKKYRPPGCVCTFPWCVCDGCKDLRRESPSSVARIHSALSSSAQTLLNGVGKSFTTKDIVALGHNIWDLIRSREKAAGKTGVIGEDVQVLLHKLAGKSVPAAIWAVVKPQGKR